ncbi:IclR family transcriptional regulator [Azospirillum sp.]|uniref:IclR family transcriptional regulator n=1 Tax=Azospirillum sp. TaxID=34012 RepID=UPI002D450715|nr:IclR family transcriptional regulator [Azospirillum sp.]HYD70086.1 IclR family transcriptional regulator [Azospirillum sp.]
MDTLKKAPQRDVGAVVHAVRILRHLAGTTTPQGVAAIARETGINTSTCFNILRTLARERLVAFNDQAKTYALGLAFAEFAISLVGVPPTELVRPELERIALNFDVMVAFWRMSDDNHIVLVDRAYPQTAVRIELKPGQRLPMWIGAVGRCAAAASGLSEAELRRRFAQLRWQDGPSFETYLREVREAGEKGWSVDAGNLYRGVLIVAAVVVDGQGRPRFGISGISIAGQSDPASVERLGEELRDASRLIGQSLFAPRAQAALSSFPIENGNSR